MKVNPGPERSFNVMDERAQNIAKPKAQLPKKNATEEKTVEEKAIAQPVANASNAIQDDAAKKEESSASPSSSKKSSAAPSKKDDNAIKQLISKKKQPIPDEKKYLTIYTKASTIEAIDAFSKKYHIKKGELLDLFVEKYLQEFIK